MLRAMVPSLAAASAKTRSSLKPLLAARKHSFAAAVAAAASSSSSSTFSSTSSSPSAPPTVALRAALSYDGSGFAGYQLQGGASGGTSGAKRKKGGGGDGAAARTVQGEVEKALLTVSSGGGRKSRERDDDERARRAALRLHAAGRTDAGVHARGQVISFALPAREAAGEGTEGDDDFFDEERLISLERSLNRLLPADLRLRHLERCPPDFSARFSALGKHYSFSVIAGAEQDPLTRRHAHFERRPRERWSRPSGFSSSGFSSSSSRSSSLSSSSLSSLPSPLLDVGAMREAASLFVGQRDFTHFASINASHPAPDPVRLVERASVTVLSGEGEGEGFGFDDDESDENLDDESEDASSSFSLSSSSSSSSTQPPRLLRLRFDFEGDGFLYRQVRHMSGALVAVGLGKLSPRDISEKLERGRKDPPASEFRGWKVADAAGLCLERVFYPSYRGFREPIHADLPHDEFGRVCVEALSERSRKREESGVVLSSGGSGGSDDCSSSSSSSSSLDEELRSVKAARRRAAGMPATGSDLLEKEKRP